MVPPSHLLVAIFVVLMSTSCDSSSRSPGDASATYELGFVDGSGVNVDAGRVDVRGQDSAPVDLADGPSGPDTSTDADPSEIDPVLPLTQFEQVPLGSCSPIATCSGDVAVQEVSVGGLTTRAMHIFDDSNTVQSRLLFRLSGAPARRFEFDLLLRSSAASTIIAVHGAGANASTGTWRFLIAPEGDAKHSATVRVWDGVWTTLGSVSGLHDPNAWGHLTLEVSTTAASLLVAGQRLTTRKKAAPSTDITGLEIASSGTVPTGTDTYVDNLRAANTGWLVATEPSGFQPRFPDIVRLPDGRLLAVYQSSPAHSGVPANHSSLKMTFSADRGKTWSAPLVAMDTPGIDDRDPKVTVLSSGVVLLNWFEDLWSDTHVFDNKSLFVARMPAGASSFGPATHVPTAGGTGYSHGSVIEAGSDLLLPFYRGGGARLIRSHDGGKTWDQSSETLVAAPDGTYRYVEPNLTRFPGGALLMVIRTIKGGLEVESVLTRSVDYGLTWSPLEPTGHTTASHHLLTTSSGKVLFTFGAPLLSKRPTYGALIDLPGQPWFSSDQAPLYDSGSSDQANPSAVEVAPGRYILLGYDVPRRKLFAFLLRDDLFVP